MHLRHSFLLLLVTLLLTACVNDSATYEIDNSREHTLTLIREQNYFWDTKINLSLVVSRLPVCIRRFSLGTGSETTPVQIYQVPSGAFIIKVNKRMYATETHTCQNFAKMDAEPADGMGTLIGSFQVDGEKLTFVRKKENTPPEEKR